MLLTPYVPVHDFERDQRQYWDSLSAAVFTRLLSPGDYGVYIIGLSIANFVSATAFTWVRYSVMRFESEGDKADVRMTSLAAYVVSAATAPAILIFVHLVAHIGWDRAALAVGLSLGLSLFELGQEILRSRLRVRRVHDWIGAALGVCLRRVHCHRGARRRRPWTARRRGDGLLPRRRDQLPRDLARSARADRCRQAQAVLLARAFGDRGGIPLHLPAFARPSVHRLAVRRQRGRPLWRVGGRRQTDHSHSGGQCRSGGVSVDRARVRHRIAPRKRVASSSAPPSCCLRCWRQRPSASL